MKTSLLYFSVLLITLFVSCQGPAGDPGPAGAKGTDGAKGADGTANVITSAWIAVAGSSWKVDAANLFSGTNSLPSTSITQTVIDKGVAMVYFRNAGNTGFSVMPYTYSNGTIDYFRLSVGQVTLARFSPTALTVPSSFATNEYRWIIVPAATLAGGRAAAIDWKNYEEVKEYLHLTD